jgi:hypothetical protein
MNQKKRLLGRFFCVKSTYSTDAVALSCEAGTNREGWAKPPARSAWPQKFVAIPIADRYDKETYPVGVVD